jgi:hypothetical protein
MTGRQGRSRLVPTFSLTRQTLPTDSQKRQRAGALQGASRIEKGLEHASAFGVRQSSAAFHSGPCD